MCDLTKSAALALLRSQRAVHLRDTLAHATGATISRALVELGVVDARAYRTGTRGLWIARLHIEWFGPEQILISIDGEGACPQSAQTDAVWRLARYYAQQARDLVRRVDAKEAA